MTTESENIIVAADGGGTGCRVAVGTIQSGILAEATGGPGNVHSDFTGAIANLTGAVSNALAKAGLADTPAEKMVAHFGVAGAHTAVEVEAVRAALPYGTSSVTGDRATSVRGALGEVDGYVVALGTGTIVARQADLEMSTVGGWGFDVSDQASGAWLGHRLLQEVVLCEDGLRDQTDLSRLVLSTKGGLIGLIHLSADAIPGDYAPLARDVVAAAQNGDPLGLELMHEGAAYVARGLDTLGFQRGDALVLAGGLGPHYAPYLADDLTQNVHAPKGSALEGAFAMAVRAAS